MIFDTDILIWVQRGSIRAANMIDNTEKRYLSILSYMELLHGAGNKNSISLLKILSGISIL
jgi:predicted nucleic acid-binding protein